MTRLSQIIAQNKPLIAGYASAISGSLGRLVFSLAYFILLANSLSIADFGLFASASATGVMLSRLLGFGFVSPLYRIATVKPQLLGAYTSGMLAAGMLSLPLIGAAGLATYLLLFAGLMPAKAFWLVLAAEALLWRPTEIIVIVNNGLGRFGRGAVLVIIGTALRAVAALMLALAAKPDLGTWTLLYMAANAISLALAAGLYYPRVRLRFRPELYWRRTRDSVMVAASEFIFYVQNEMDKLLVLALSGPAMAGTYAIIMRLVDLTAIPVRTFSMMLVQKMMRSPDVLSGFRRRFSVEAAIFLVSTLGMAALAGILWFFPSALGQNVAPAAALAGLALLVPGFRNLIEYQAELLYGRGQTGLRALSLAAAALAKGILLGALLAAAPEEWRVIAGLNGVFAALYLMSAMITYPALSRKSRAV